MWEGDEGVDEEEILHSAFSPAEVGTREEKDVVFFSRALGVVVEVVDHQAIPIGREGDIEFEEQTAD